MYSRTELVDLNKYSEEFQHVQQKIRSTLSVTVDEVKRVQNLPLWGVYTLKKEEMINRWLLTREVELFHATSRSNVDSICTNNFDWRRASRVKYGAGVSFSPSASYANLECNKYISLGNRVLILAKVLVGRSCTGNEGLTLPVLETDTSVGNSLKVYVKFGDHEFYPAYVAYYESPEIIYGRRRRYR